ncbi:TPA: hypothetical protein N0F65_004742 [Lagenidium giganteum]|uniref:C2 domain-containing protein n=1 Tax=Lagenidium giganteum TaxID=4803 RepID=A0AAV2YIV5_9STRA|nr:TPA: hypothetical protein N0F65_004742 [Lagenidium giganteum]
MEPAQPAREKSSRSVPKFTLLLRVHSCAALKDKTSHGIYCKLYMGDTEMSSGSQSFLSSFIPDDPNDTNNSNNAPTHRTFRTSQQRHNVANPVWNEKFQIAVNNPGREILTVRVKSQHTFFAPCIGACVVPLRSLTIGDNMDQLFSLTKGQSHTGNIRLQLALVPADEEPQCAVAPAPQPRSVTAPRPDNQADNRGMEQQRRRVNTDSEDARNWKHQQSMPEYQPHRMVERPRNDRSTSEPPYRMHQQASEVHPRPWMTDDQRQAAEDKRDREMRDESWEHVRRYEQEVRPPTAVTRSPRSRPQTNDVSQAPGASDDDDYDDPNGLTMTMIRQMAAKMEQMSVAQSNDGFDQFAGDRVGETSVEDSFDREVNLADFLGIMQAPPNSGEAQPAATFVSVTSQQEFLCQVQAAAHDELPSDSDSDDADGDNNNNFRDNNARDVSNAHARPQYYAERAMRDTRPSNAQANDRHHSPETHGREGRHFNRSRTSPPSPRHHQDPRAVNNRPATTHTKSWNEPEQPEWDAPGRVKSQSDPRYDNRKPEDYQQWQYANHYDVPYHYPQPQREPEYTPFKARPVVGNNYDAPPPAYANVYENQQRDTNEPQQRREFQDIPLDYKDPKEQVPMPSIGDLFKAGCGIYKLANSNSDELVENAPEALKDMAPLGKFLTTKILNASHPAQPRQEKQPTYFF